MRKVVLYLEESKLNNEDFDNGQEGNVEFVDEESEISIFASSFVDKTTDEYPSTGRIYIRMNEGNFVVRGIRDADWDEACKIMDDEHRALQKLLRENKP